jgi:large subunit ribosomal protein L14
MIQIQTKLKIIDNSGARFAGCIKVLGGSKKKIGRVGDIIIMSIKQVRARGKSQPKIKKGVVTQGIIAHTKKEIRRKDGQYIKFDQNSVIILSKNKPLASRILAPITKELRKNKISKILSLAPNII